MWNKMNHGMLDHIVSMGCTTRLMMRVAAICSIVCKLCAALRLLVSCQYSFWLGVLFNVPV